MNFKQEIPEYLINRKNTIIQIAFTTLFAFVFINIYMPFGAENWYQINEWQFFYLSGAVVLTGMVTVILSRLLLFYLKRNHLVTIALYAWLIASEVIFMGGFYTVFEIVILHDKRPTFDILFNAVQNTTLILLIPYLLSSLFFAWSDIKAKFEQVVRKQQWDSNVRMIPFSDENGKLRFTLPAQYVLYLESDDNYIKVYYLDSNQVRINMFRGSMKLLERDLRSYPVYRCHRSYFVNALNVKQLRRGKRGYEILLDAPKEIIVPVSKTYLKFIISKFKFNEPV
jgi:hypothetical protein